MPRPLSRIGNGAIDMDGDVDFGAITGEMFVDRVVENFENAVMQTALVRVADIHARAFPDRFQTLEFIDLGGVVFLAISESRSRRFGDFS